MCGGTREGSGRYEERLEIGARPSKTGVGTGATPQPDLGGTPRAMADLVRRRATAETPFVADSSGIAYRLQEKALAALKPPTVRLLERIADDAAARRKTVPTPAKIRLTTGTVLSAAIRN
jgi:hypothetical protein